MKPFEVTLEKGLSAKMEFTVGEKDTAKYYGSGKSEILATPALALIRAKALGTNPVWQNMVAMMLTGELTSSTKWQGKRVVGIIGDRRLHQRWWRMPVQ